MLSGWGLISPLCWTENRRQTSSRWRRVLRVSGEKQFYTRKKTFTASSSLPDWERWNFTSENGYITVALWMFTGGLFTTNSYRWRRWGLWRTFWRQQRRVHHHPRLPSGVPASSELSLGHHRSRTFPAHRPQLQPTLWTGETRLQIWLHRDSRWEQWERRPVG